MMIFRTCSKVLLACIIIFLHATSAFAATTERVSVSSSGAQGHAAVGSPTFGRYLSFAPSISADGRYVAFTTDCGTLVPNDTNGKSDVFVRDRVNGTTSIVSLSSSGEIGNGACVNTPAISADGRYVAFEADSSNLVEGDTNGVIDVFVRDLLTETTERISVSSTEEQANGQSNGSSIGINADGRYVAFRSSATNLVPDDTNSKDDVFVRDRLDSTTERVSISSSGEQGNDDSPYIGISISADGRYVAFDSSASNLFAGDIALGYPDVLVRGRFNGTTELISGSLTGSMSIGMNVCPSISPDGRYVTFSSAAPNIVPGDANGYYDVFIHDRVDNSSELVSISSEGTQGNQESYYSVLSSDGRFVVFRSTATNLDASTIQKGIYVRDLTNLTTKRVSISDAGVPGSGDYNSPCMSADGRYIAFTSSASTLVPDDTNGKPDVFVRDRGPAPSNTSLTPNSGTIIIGKKTALTSVYSDASGYVNIKECSLMMNKGATTTGAGYFFYDAVNNLLYLRNIADDAMIGGYEPGSADVIDNGNIILYCADTTIENDGNDMTINWSIALKPYFDGSTCTASMQVTNISELTDPMEQMGTFNTFAGKIDMLIKSGSESTYSGTGVFSIDGDNQMKSQNISPNQKVVYSFKAKNSGIGDDSFKITGPSGGDGWSVKYYDLTTNAEVTSQVTGAGWSSGTMTPGGCKGIYANVRPDATVPAGSMKTLLMTAVSELDDTAIDVVKAVTTLVGTYKVDLLIKSGTESSYSGIGIFGTDGVNQTKSQDVSAGQKVTYAFKAQNAGNVVDSFKITGPAGGDGWSVKYYDLATNADVTSQVTGGGWVSRTLASKGNAGIYVNVRPNAGMPAGSIKTLLITATSVTDDIKIDVVKAVTSVP